MRTNIILASLLALVGYAYVGSESEVKELIQVIDFQEKAGVRAAEVMIDNSDQKVLLHNRHLEDEAKFNYRSLIPLIEQLRHAVNDIRKSKEALIKEFKTEKVIEKQKSKQLREFIQSTRNLMSENRAIISYYLSSNKDLFGLREKDIKAYNQDVFDQLRFEHWIELQKGLKLSGNRHSAIVNGLYLELTTVVDDVINSLSSLSGGRALICNFGIPINIYLIKKGDYSGDLATILFECPGFSLNRNVPNIDIKVNGKKLKIDHNGIAIYQGHRRRSGIVTIEYTYTNPVTGKNYDDAFDYSLDGRYADPIIK